MQGILIVDKPMDWTSFDVVAKLRGVLGTRKLGHSGTLDPMATGVLPVFCGGASKAVDLQLNHNKSYRAVLKLGAPHRHRDAPRPSWKRIFGQWRRRNCWLPLQFIGLADAGAAHALGHRPNGQPPDGAGP